MKLDKDDNEQRHLNAIDLRLVARLRHIADAQRAPQHLRDRVFSDIAGEQISERRRGIRWDLIAAATGGAFMSTAAALILWGGAYRPTGPAAG